MAGKGLVIKIDGDASGLEKELSTVEKSAKSAAAALGHEYAKAGMSLQQGMSKAWAEVQKAQKSGQTIVINGVETIISKNKEVISQKDDLGDVYDEIGNGAKNASVKIKAGLADIKAGIDMAAAAARTLYGVTEKGINYNANIEQLKTSFEVMTGSAEKATETVEKLRVMGAETPFEMKDLASTTQLLMQYGFTADEALDRMSMLGDVAQGNVNAMNSIALGYAQMSSAGKVNLVDIKQMINGGFNPLQEISERTGESMASLYDRISKGKMTVDEITESMRHATSEGGRFYQSMEKQSQTLNGQLSTLKDNADQLLGSLTEGVSEGLRDQLLPFANNLVAELQEAFDTGGYQGLVDTATDMIPDLLGMMTGELQRGIEGLSRWLPQGASKLMQALPSALRAGATVTPQLTQALFEVASTVVGDLVSMLPELAPVVLEGFENMFVSTLGGMYKMIGSIFDGIEQAFHKGQSKIAGVWVDDEAVAKYTFDLTTDTEPAISSIESAYRDIRAALNTDLLTPEQKQEVMKSIGDDYDEIKAKLMSFGMSDIDAGAIASQITSAGDAIRAEIDKLNLGVDSNTVLKWISQANGSRLMLKSILASTALTPAQQSEVVGVFETMTNNINGQLPDVVSEIYETLTNGQAADDDPKSLKEKLDEAFGADIAEVEQWLTEKIGALDTESATYASDVAALSEEAAAYKAEIETLHAQMAMLVDSLAGQPTSVVEARMAEFAEIEARLAEINSYIDDTTAKARSAEEAAFQVVRSGAQADESTIAQAISFKVKEFKLDEQSAEDEYQKTVESLNMQLANKDIGEIQYNARVNTEISQMEDTKAEAKRKLEEALGEIFRGIAEAEGVDSAMQEAGTKIDLSTALFAAVESLEGASGLLGDQLGTEITQILADHLQFDPGILEAMPVDTVQGYLQSWAADLFVEAEEIVAGLDNTKVMEAYQAALTEGALSGTSFDTENGAAQLTTLLSAMYTTAAENASGAAQGAGSSLMNDAASGASDSGSLGKGLGGDFGSGYVSGIAAWVSRAYSAAYSVSRAAAKGAAAGQDSASPSKVAIGLGHDFGEGYTIGLQDSMARAANVARKLTGNIATSATLTQSMRVNIPTLTQDIILANEQSDRSVNLYVNGKELGRVMAPDNQLAQNRYNRSIALGVGKK